MPIIETHWTHEWNEGEFYRELTLKNDYSPPTGEDKLGEAQVIEIMDDLTRTCLQFEFRPAEHGYELLITFPTDWRVPNCTLTEYDLDDILSTAEEKLAMKDEIRRAEQEDRREDLYLEERRK
jgi:hypothetical protein